MPQARAQQEAFLPAPYLAVVETRRELVDSLTYPSDPSVSANLHMLGLVRRVFLLGREEELFMKDELKKLPEDIETPDDMRQTLQYDATGVLVRDLGLAAPKRLTAVQTGLAKSIGDEETVENGYRAARRVIEFRAQSVATGLLRATDMLFKEHSHPKLEIPVWDKVGRVNSRKHSPPRCDVSDENWQEMVRLQDATYDLDPSPRPLVVLGKSRVLNAVKIARSVYRQRPTRDSGEGPSLIPKPTQIIDQLVAQHPGALDLSRGEIRRTATTVTEILDYVGKTGRTSPAVYQDPRTQYVTFVGRNLRAHDIERETENFERDVNRVEAYQRGLAA